MLKLCSHRVKKKSPKQKRRRWRFGAFTLFERIHMLWKFSIKKSYREDRFAIAFVRCEHSLRYCMSGFHGYSPRFRQSGVVDRRTRYGENRYDQRLHGQVQPGAAPVQVLQLLLRHHTLHVPGKEMIVSFTPVLCNSVEFIGTLIAFQIICINNATYHGPPLMALAWLTVAVDRDLFLIVRVYSP